MRTKQMNWMQMVVICMVLVLLGTAVQTSVSCAALTAGADGKTTWAYMGAGKDGKQYKSTNTSNNQPKYTVKVGGTSYVGYCIDPDKGWGRGTKMVSRLFGNSYAVKRYSKTKQELLSYVLLYGYNYGVDAPYGNANDYYAATQTLIWQVLDGHVVMDLDTGKWTKTTTSDKPYTLIKGHAYGVQCYNYIKKQMTNHVKGPSFAKGTLTKAQDNRYVMKYNYKTQKWSATIEDTNGYFNYKMLKGDDGITVHRNGNKYTFSKSTTGNASVTLTNTRSITSQAAMVFDSSSSKIQSVALGATDNKRYYVSFETQKYGYGKIKKVDVNGKVLSGFKFRITCAANGYDKTWTTGKDGMISAKLCPGTYKVTEKLTSTQVKNNWIGAAPTTIVIKAGKTSTIKITNKRDDKAGLRIIKSVSDDGSVSGFRFKVEGNTGDSKSITVNDIRMAAAITAPDGSKLSTCTIADSSVVNKINSDLKVGRTGTYNVKFNVSLVRMVKSTSGEHEKVLNVASYSDIGEIKDDNNIEQTEEEEEQTSSCETISANESSETREAEAGETLENATDTVEEAESIDVTKAETEASGAEASGPDTDGDDSMQANENIADENVLNESEIPDIIADEKTEEKTEEKPLVIEEKVQEVARANSVKSLDLLDAVTITVPVTTYVKGATHGSVTTRNMNGIKFKNVYWAGVTSRYSKTFTTGTSGRISISDLKFGTYEITEVMTTAQAARYKQPKAQRVTLNDKNRNQIIPFFFENVAKERHVKVIKKCSDGKIGDKSFKLTGTYAWGTTMPSKVVHTNASGIADFGELPAGSYKVEEINLDLTKYLPVAAQTFKITGTEKDGTILYLTFTNIPVSSVEISKQDATTCEELPGASLVLTEKSTGKIVDQWVSTDKPHVIKNLVNGKVLVLKETIAPDGYLTASQVEIVVGSDKKVVMYDEITQVVVSKVDAANSEELPGAELSVIDPETDEVVEKWVSEVEPHLIQGLTLGKTYKLVENQAPLGYETAEAIEFVVGHDNEVVMKDEHVPETTTEPSDETEPETVPVETTVPDETTEPDTTTEPVETTEVTETDRTTEPAVTTEPKETTAPGKKGIPTGDSGAFVMILLAGLIAAISFGVVVARNRRRLD